MGVPKHRVSKTRARMRRAHASLTAREMVKCPNCGAMIKPHRVCKACGEYKGQKVTKEDNE